MKLSPLLALVLLTPPCFAGTPALDSQDPICDSIDVFKTEFDNARPLHKKYSQLRAAADEQQKWFGAVTGEMSSICAADKKFAASLLAKDRSALTGQCKPAEEAAFYDQQMLDHSEESIKTLKTKKEEFLFKGVKGVTDNLPAIYARDKRLIEDNVYTLMEVPFAAACELKWLYPAPFLQKTTAIEGCTDLPQYNRPAEQDKKDPALFNKLLTRFDLSLSYNVTRRNNAAAAAKASRAKFDACVLQFPSYVPTILKAGQAQGSGAKVPAGNNPSKGSTITGIKEDQKKQDKK